MKLLITGSDGFIGTELKNFLKKNGHRVTGTVFFKKPEKDEIHIDITDREDINKLPDSRFDAVIHTIGEVDQAASYRKMYKINIDGTRIITEAAKKNGWPHLIHISSVAVYGFKTMGENRTEDLTKRSGNPFAISYMRTKAKAEKIVEVSGLDYTILRLPAIVGPNDNSLSPVVIPALVDGSFFLCGKKDKKSLLILTFSRFGAHYPDKKLHDRVPHSHPHSRKERVREVVESYLDSLDTHARNVFT
ncbi:hypothetical protein ES703_120821 [subsurface metagenome]